MCPAGAALGAGQVESAISSFGAGSLDLGAGLAPRRLRHRDPGRGFRAETGRIPASTMKLVTSAGALLHGPAFRFETRVVADASTVRRGKALVGADLPEAPATPSWRPAPTPPATWAGGPPDGGARAPPRSGIRLVRGPIVADERIFDSRRLGPGWPSHYRYYASPSPAGDEPRLRRQRAQRLRLEPRSRRPSA